MVYRAARGAERTHPGGRPLATVAACRKAVRELSSSLAAVDPELRAKHVPSRTVACRVQDLGLTFVGRIDEGGVHDVAESSDESDVDIRLTLDSDVLVALAAGEEDFLRAWVRGRVQVSASVRDLLRLRSLAGM